MLFTVLTAGAAVGAAMPAVAEVGVGMGARFSAALDDDAALEDAAVEDAAAAAEEAGAVADRAPAVENSALAAEEFAAELAAEDELAAVLALEL